MQETSVPCIANHSSLRGGDAIRRPSWPRRSGCNRPLPSPSLLLEGSGPHILLILNPLTRSAQQISQVLHLLRSALDASVSLHLNPQVRMGVSAEGYESEGQAALLAARLPPPNSVRHPHLLSPSRRPFLSALHLFLPITPL